MSVQTAMPRVPSGLKRSGSINLLRGRTGSLRKRDGHKRSNSNQAIPKDGNLAVPGIVGDAWSKVGTTADLRPVVQYAVTITAGPNTDSKKPREKRRMFGGFLHKKSQSKGFLPQIDEADQALKTPKRSITPALFRDDFTEARRASRGHSRSTSAMSFFHPDPIHRISEDGDETVPFPKLSAGQVRPGSSDDSKPKGHQPEAVRNKSAPQVLRKPVITRQTSDETASGRSSEDSKPERPKLRILTKSNEPAIPPQQAEGLNLGLIPAHPPRKSSLPGNDVTSPSLGEPERPGSSKEALTKSFETSAQHRRQRSKDLVIPVVNRLDPIGPTPPPKDNDRGYHMEQIQNQLIDGLKVTIPDRSPLRLTQIFGELDPRSAAVRNLRSSARSSKNGLPSPRLSSPTRSTLATRRKAVPATIKVVARSRKKNVHGVLGSTLSPGLSSNRVKKSRGSSRSSSKLSSPAIGKAVTTNEVKVIAMVPGPPAPVRRAPPPPPLQLQIPGASLKQVATLKSQSEGLMVPVGIAPAPATDPIIRAPEIPQEDMGPTPPAKSPKRISASAAAFAKQKQNRRSISDGQIPTIYTVRSSARRKSVHRRKPTGFRLNAKEKEVALRGRQNERPSLPGLEQTMGMRRSQSPQMNLTPPQTQGEWAHADAKGRRQPSPLRTASSTERERGAGADVGKSNDSLRTTTAAVASMQLNSGAEISTAGTPSTSRRQAREREAAMARAARSERKQAKILGTAVASTVSIAKVTAPSQERVERERPVRTRAPSFTAMIPMAPNPLAAHPMGLADRTIQRGQSPETRAAGRAKLVDAGHKLTAEESFKEMLQQQEKQAVAIRMKLLGLPSGMI